mgnify:CR=1 FL=1
MFPTQGWAVVPGFYGIPVPVPQIPGIGTGTGTQSHGTVGTGTKICGTVPVLKSRGTTNPGISGQASRSVPGRSRCPGIQQAGPERKIAGLSRPVPCPSLIKSMINTVYG